MAQVLLLATLDTKVDEAGFLLEQLRGAGITTRVIDISLQTGGAVLGGAEKRAAMDAAANAVLKDVSDAAAKSAEVVVAIGGGTGGEIALSVLRALPITFPKVFVTTLPFDPRVAVADNSIVLVPTLADLCGLNAMLRDVLENTAHMVAGLCRKARKGELTDVASSVGITALGATDSAVKALVNALQDAGRESAVFHSNGYGGAAFARFAARGAFDAIIDLTPHELTRMHIAGAHVDMPERFTAGATLPRIVFPGALNFIGLGEKSSLSEAHLERQHYEHSGFFTHVKVSDDEMRLLATKLADAVNGLSGPSAVIVPMGGFSHHDRRGGPIEDPSLREICRATLRERLLDKVPLITVDAHISAPDVTSAIMHALSQLTAQKDAAYARLE